MFFLKYNLTKDFCVAHWKYSSVGWRGQYLWKEEERLISFIGYGFYMWLVNSG